MVKNLLTNSFNSMEHRLVCVHPSTVGIVVCKHFRSLCTPVKLHKNALFKFESYKCVYIVAQIIRVVIIINLNCPNSLKGVTKGCLF